MVLYDREDDGDGDLCIMPTQSLYSIIYMIVMTMVMVTLMIMTAILILQGFER